MDIIEWDGKPVSKPGCYRNMPIDFYHGPNPAVGPSISSSGLRDIFQVSPSYFWSKWPGNPKRDKKENEASSLKMGRAVHHLALGEADFKEHFVVHPETYTDRKTGDEKKWTTASIVCKEWLKAEQRTKNRTVLSPQEFDDVRGMLGVLPSQTELDDAGILKDSMYNNGALSGLIEHSLFWQDSKTGVWLRCRPDAIPTDGTDAADLKTTSSVQYRDICLTIGKFGYDMQAALVCQGIREVWGIELSSYALLFVQNASPYSSFSTALRMEALDRADKALRVSIDTFAHLLNGARRTGPGGTQTDAVYVDIPDWMEQQRIERIAFLERELTQ